MLACPVFGTTLHAATCPSTSIKCGMEKDAAGNPVWVERELPPPGECTQVLMEIPKDSQFQICGPGKFSFSRLSCDRHDHKKVELVQPTNSFTATTCKTYNFADYPALNGYIGSAKYTCDETAR